MNGTPAERSRRFKAEQNPELRARQAAGEIRLRPDQAQSQPNVEAVIGAARYALAEATTAAHVLTQRLDDAVRLLTDVVDS